MRDFFFWSRWSNREYIYTLALANEKKTRQYIENNSFSDTRQEAKYDSDP